jgi:hypothetical protein
MTYTGTVITPLNPDPGDVRIEDIAHALALQSRFTGHVRKFYSVAQHCLLVSELLPEYLRLVGLLHDASEAYLSDIARPVKKTEPFATAYRIAEEKLEKCVASAFDIPYPWPDEVKAADNIMGRAEARDLMNEVFPWATFGEDPPHEYEKVIEPWGPDKAERKFLERYEELIS